MSIALLMAAALTSPIRWRRRRSQQVSANAVADLCALLGLAVDGGMSLLAAMGWAMDFADPCLRSGLSGVLRNATRVGLAAALRSAEGPAAESLMALARPVETGARIGPVLEGLRDRLAAEHSAAVEERLQQLPVKLLLPLALLMLPGLVLMIVAPALFDALSRLG